MYPKTRCSNCYEQREKCPDIELECETEDGCRIPETSTAIKRALAVRQDLHRLKTMGWPDRYKEEYIKKEYAPNLHMIQISMLADEYIEEIQQKKQEQQNARQKAGRT